MAGYTQTATRFALIRSLLEQTFVAPPDRGGFSPTRRSAQSYLTDEGRTITASDTSQVFSGQSASSVSLTVNTYVVEFTIVSLSGTVGALGLAGSERPGTTSDYGANAIATSSGLPFAAGDVIGMVAGGGDAVVSFFKNGAFVPRGGTPPNPGTTPYRFFAACDPGDAGDFKVTAESRQDSMKFADLYAMNFSVPLLDWPAADIADDGLPAAPPPPPPGPVTPAVFDDTRSPIGTLSNSNKTITSGTATDDQASAIGQGSVKAADPDAHAGYAVEITINSPIVDTMSVGILGGGVGAAPGGPAGMHYDKSGSNSFGSPSSAWTTGDKLGIVVYSLARDSVGGRIAFFRNGTFVACGGVNSFFVFTPELRFYVYAYIYMGPNAAQYTAECDIDAMTHGDVYKAYREDGETMTDAQSWPADDVP